MCIISFHVKEHPSYKLIVIANRDEFYKRPTRQAEFWEDSPELLAGRDLEAMGTWMGITKTGKFAALTNYRDPNQEMANQSSRGDIISSFLTGDTSSKDFLTRLQSNRHHYNGFNLLIGTIDDLYFYSKQDNMIQSITPGTYSVSNASLNTPWPKVEKARTNLHDYVKSHEKVIVEDLFKQLNDDEKAEDELLPSTGIDTGLERQLSSIFIKTNNYGTRSSTVILVTHDNHVTFVERTFKHGVKSKQDVKEQFYIV